MVDRATEIGFCRASDKIRIARAALHHWEEPCISGENGSGTVFFSFCPLKCVFCQNYELSHENMGKEISIEKLADIFLDLQDQKEQNINLVTPTHYTPQIRKVLIKVKDKLHIPVVYNTSSYENVGTLMMMRGLVDIYLADLRYFDDSLGEKYSGCRNYFETATMAIDEMYT